MVRDIRELVLLGAHELRKLDQFVEEICDYYNISTDYFGNIQLATTEAAQILFALNGEKGHPAMMVTFGRKPEGLNFKLRLRDDDILHDSTDELLEKEIRKHKLARDIYIVKALADEVQISTNGKSIAMVFYVSGLNYEKSLKRINELVNYWTKQGSLIRKKENG